ncbi:hypothetical protein [Streptomyces xanthii]|uniref:Uncharacterized protein n=1 Tax=Streptomyces xanthii TaxID=2768069 RepID=A0A7H1B3Y9_9ACTN|nr:hypothetical protein [Streptomyces xanthii]QNS03444.1 hypothetical protein IAG42_07220 [Streptomyces xanthii]
MNSGGEQGGSSVSDEEWERFLRESEEGVRDAPQEPSARARMVTRRLQEEDPQDGNGRGWRTYSPARPRRRTGWYVAGILAALAVVLWVLAPDRVTHLFGAGGVGSAPDATPLGAETAPPTGPPPSTGTLRGTRAEPFRGSPAARWADGAAGISVPAPRATAWMDEAQVAKALDRSRDFLVASSLDREVLRGARPSEAIAYINPKQPREQEFIETSLRSPSEKYDPLVLFSRFDPDRTSLVGDVVKVRGRLSYEEGPGPQHALRVTTDVTYVYPVVAAAGDPDEVTRVIVRRQVVMDWQNPEKVVTKAGTFSVHSNMIHTTNAGCRTHNGFLTPTFDGPGASDGPTADPYDRSAPVVSPERDGECGTATRS